MESVCLGQVCGSSPLFAMAGHCCSILILGSDMALPPARGDFRTSQRMLSMDALQEHKQQKVIAFMLTCACVDLWASLIKRLPEAAGLQVAALHGRMKQSQRQSTLAHFASQPAGSDACEISSRTRQDLLGVSPLKAPYYQLQVRRLGARPLCVNIASILKRCSSLPGFFSGSSICSLLQWTCQSHKHTQVASSRPPISRAVRARL